MNRAPHSNPPTLAAARQRLYTGAAMIRRVSHAISVALLLALLAPVLGASAYDANPKLVVVIVIDQFRADFLERSRSQFGPDGFRLLMDRGAYFTDCYYDYAATRTGPGHATLLTGAYVPGHGIMGNEWWDGALKKSVTTVEDPAYPVFGAAGESASARNLRASTLGDELKLATGGRARVFAVSLKDRSAVLPGGHAADAAYWINADTGAFTSSRFYMQQLPPWVEAFNRSEPEKYWNREWRDANGKVLRITKPTEPRDFYHTVGATPFVTDYELDFVRTLIQQEKLGNGPATDLLIVSLSANDILGHSAGPDSPQVQAMTVATDRQLAAFFGFLSQQVGPGNFWVALSADHGAQPASDATSKLRFPGADTTAAIRQQVNASLAAQFRRAADYVAVFDWPAAFLNEKAFAAAGVTREADAERIVGEAMRGINGIEGYFTKVQIAAGQTPDTPLGRKYVNAYTPLLGWYVFAVPTPYAVKARDASDHFTPWSYDEHVPMIFYGSAFAPGVYRGRCEPVDLAPTLSSLLGINRPSASSGRVLTEALRTARPAEAP